MTEPNVEQELAELGKLVEWHEAVKAQNDKAEKPRFVMPNRREKRRAKKRKAQG